MEGQWHWLLLRLPCFTLLSCSSSASLRSEIPKSKVYLGNSCGNQIWELGKTELQKLREPWEPKQQGHSGLCCATRSTNFSVSSALSCRERTHLPNVGRLSWIQDVFGGNAPAILLRGMRIKPPKKQLNAPARTSCALFWYKQSIINHRPYRPLFGFPLAWPQPQPFDNRPSPPDQRICLRSGQRQKGFVLVWALGLVPRNNHWLHGKQSKYQDAVNPGGCYYRCDGCCQKRWFF